MPKYEVEITEYLQRRITVEAESEADAVSKVEEDYNNDKKVLDYSDHTKTEIEIYKDSDFVYCHKIEKESLGCLSEKYKSTISGDYVVNTCTWEVTP